MIQGRRAWAATTAAGPGATAKADPQGALPAPGERDALLALIGASTQQLLDALREAGPDRGCWTWWGKTHPPQNCRALARRQLHEIAVHTYDAQLTLGAPQPLPDEVALDGVEEFLSTSCTTTVPWPHEPAAVDYLAIEGRLWRNWLSADGARAARTSTTTGIASCPGEGHAAHACATGTANEIVLAFYGRIPLDSLALEGKRDVFDQLVDWDPER